MEYVTIFSYFTVLFGDDANMVTEDAKITLLHGRDATKSSISSAAARNAVSFIFILCMFGLSDAIPTSFKVDIGISRCVLLSIYAMPCSRYICRSSFSACLLDMILLTL